MKKIFNIVFAFIFVFALLALNVPSLVQAKTDPVGDNAKPGVAEGSWVVTTGTGTELDITNSVATAPNWLQLLAKGIKLEAGSKICHPLRGGQYGWVGEIRQLKDGKWIKLATTNGWVPSTEGEYMACATAPSAGTYALFGYYIKPEVAQEPSPSFDCSTLVWSGVDAGADGNVIIHGYLSNVPTGTTISFTILSSNPLNASGSGSGTVEEDGWFSIPTSINGGAYESITFYLYESSHNCQNPSTVTYIAA